MIRRLQITDLFGVEGNNKQINFHEDLTLMVGRNGSGKTTILNMLHALLTCSFRSLFRHRFGHVELETDNALLRVTRVPKNLELERRDRREDGSFGEPRRTKVKAHTDRRRVRDAEFDDYALGIEALYFPTYRRLETDLDELLEDSWEAGPLGYWRDRKEYGMMPWLRNIQAHAPWGPGEYPAGLPRIVVGFSRRDIEQIVRNESERVERFERERLNEMIHDFVATLVTGPTPRLGSELEGRQKLYDELHESLTHTGLTACLGDNPDKAISDYVKMVIESQSQLDSLTARKKHSSGELDQAYSAAMNVMSHGYVTKFLDMYREARSQIEENQAPFKELSRVLEHFMDQPIRIENGRLVFSEDGKLGFEHLSAGEKQLVTFFVYTKLAVRPGGVVLIDEPELSLHIEWQRDLLSRLIPGKEPIQYLIATHSPMIISGYRDHVVPIGLDGGGEEA